MKRRTILIAGVAVIPVLALLAAWWLAPRQQLPNVGQPTQTEDAAKSGVNAAPTAATPPREDAGPLQQHERAKTISRLIESSNVPIDFWGKVIDQNGNPVASVEVTFIYTTEHANVAGVAWGRQEVHQGSVVSDQTGVFSITGLRGNGLSIKDLRKEGFEYKPHRSSSFDYYGSTAAGKFTPDPRNPFLFVMVNQTTAEPLVSYGGNFGKTMRVPGDGTPSRWNLWNGQPDPKGDLQITFSREPAALARVGPPRAWSAKVEVVGGGITEAPADEAIYRAPEDGYASAVDYPKVEQKRGVSARTFYVKTADGKYGRVQLELYPGDEGPTARCLIKAQMNPSGSRNLQ